MAVESYKLKRIIRILGNLLMVAALGFVIYRLATYRIDYSVLLNGYNLLALAIFCIVYALNVLIAAVSWKIIVRFLGYKDISFRDIQMVFCKSNLMKYIPGNVMQYVGRNELAVMHDLSHRRIAYSTVLDTFANVVATSLIAFICYGGGISLFFKAYEVNLTVVVLVVAAALVLLGILIFRYRKRVLEAIREINLPRYALCMVLYALLALCSATIYVSILHYILQMSISVELLPTIIGAYLLSWTIGFVVPGAPGGVGVREAAISVFLGGVLGTENVLLAIVVFRVVNTVGDVLAYMFCLSINALESLCAR